MALLGVAHVHLSDHLRSAAAAGWRVATVHDRDDARAEAVARLTGARRGGFEGVHAAIVCSETRHHEADLSAALSGPAEPPRPPRRPCARDRRDGATSAGSDGCASMVAPRL